MIITFSGFHGFSKKCHRVDFDFGKYFYLTTSSRGKQRQARQKREEKIFAMDHYAMDL